MFHYYKSAFPCHDIYVGYQKPDVVHDAVTFLQLMLTILCR